MQFCLICNFLDYWCIRALTVCVAFLRLFAYIFYPPFCTAEFYLFIGLNNFLWIKEGSPLPAFGVQSVFLFKVCKLTFGSVSGGG